MFPYPELCRDFFHFFTAKHFSHCDHLTWPKYTGLHRTHLKNQGSVSITLLEQENLIRKNTSAWFKICQWWWILHISLRIVLRVKWRDSINKKASRSFLKKTHSISLINSRQRYQKVGKIAFPLNSELGELGKSVDSRNKNNIKNHSWFGKGTNQ